MPSMTEVVYLIPGHGAVVNITLPGISAPVFAGVEEAESVLSADRRNLQFSAHPLPAPGNNVLICKLVKKDTSEQKDGATGILDDVLQGRVTKISAKTWTVLRSMLACGADPSTMSVFLKDEQN
jgi:hypothetical protein